MSQAGSGQKAEVSSQSMDLKFNIGPIGTGVLTLPTSHQVFLVFVLSICPARRSLLACSIRTDSRALTSAPMDAMV